MPVFISLIVCCSLMCGVDCVDVSLFVRCRVCVVLLVVFCAMFDVLHLCVVVLSCVMCARVWFVLFVFVCAVCFVRWLCVCSAVVSLSCGVRSVVCLYAWSF